MLSFAKIHENINENFVLMNTQSGEVYEINDTSKCILNLCNGMNSIEDIYMILEKNNSHDKSFDVTLDDVAIFINKVIKYGLCAEV